MLSPCLGGTDLPCLEITWISWLSDLPGTDWREKPGWDAWSQFEYYIDHGQDVYKPEGERQCRLCGAHLASVPNEQEHEFLVRKL